MMKNLNTSNMTRVALLGCISILALVSAYAVGAPPKASIARGSSMKTDGPRVETIIAKYLKAIGGQELLKSVKSYKTTGHVMFMNTKRDVTTNWKGPNLLRYHVKHSSGVMTIVYDGKQAWGRITQGGSSRVYEVPPIDTEIVRLDADFAGLLVDYKEKGNQLSFNGSETVGGRSLFRVHVTQRNGSEHDCYLDEETYMLLRVTGKVSAGGQTVRYENTLGDYRPVNGLLLAHTIDVKSDLGNSHTELTKIELNGKVDKHLFDKLREDD